METATRNPITIETSINAPLKKVWTLWTDPNHIMQWCNASEDWHAPYSDNDLQVNGKFKTTMAAKDGSMRFDFEGEYTGLEPFKLIEYTIGDGRKVKILFSSEGNRTRIVEIFEPESINPVDMQRGGWQAILDNFKKYAEADAS